MGTQSKLTIEYLTALLFEKRLLTADQRAMVLAKAMLSAVSQDASRASNPEHKRDLESLYDWLEENINSRLVSAK